MYDCIRTCTTNNYACIITHTRGNDTSHYLRTPQIYANTRKISHEPDIHTRSPHMQQNIKHTTHIFTPKGTGKEDSAGAEKDGNIGTRAVADGQSGQIRIEDPEADYWRVHKAPPKNQKNVLKEFTKKLASAAATKKLDIGDLELCALPEKVCCFSAFVNVLI